MHVHSQKSLDTVSTTVYCGVRHKSQQLKLKVLSSQLVTNATVIVNSSQDTVLSTNHSLWFAC